MPDPCTLCETRKPRRWCPGVRQQICTQCCGSEREVTVDCPFDCEFLIDARRHERTPAIERNQVPNLDVKITEGFLHRTSNILTMTSAALLDAAMNTPGASDGDIREALQSLIKTYRTLQSGLIYESRPTNPFADSIQRHVQAAVQQIKEQVFQTTGVHSVRDSDVLGVLVYLQRIEYANNNGRRRGRAFLHLLWNQLQQARSVHGPAVPTP